jgi:hypothetical protein
MPHIEGSSHHKNRNEKQSLETRMDKGESTLPFSDHWPESARPTIERADARKLLQLKIMGT